jgi:hypothetical protein
MTPFSRTLTMLTVIGGVFAVPQAANADFLLGADLDIAPALTGGDAANVGGGFAGRLGAQFGVPMLTLTPELVGSYHSFGGDAHARVYRGQAGLRLGVGEVVRPGIYSHIGVGRLNADAPYEGLERTAFGFDAGGLLDITPLPIIDIGIHGGYNHLFGDDNPAFKWVTLGVHVDLVF